MKQTYHMLQVVDDWHWGRKLGLFGMVCLILEQNQDNHKSLKEPKRINKCVRTVQRLS